MKRGVRKADVPSNNSDQAWVDNASAGGPAAIRGFLCQTLIALLEAIDDPTWNSVTLEPDDESEKVDILWKFPNLSKAVQVKVSQIPFTTKKIKDWSDGLVRSMKADLYELRLVGIFAPSIARRSLLPAKSSWHR